MPTGDFEVKLNRLRGECDPDSLGFETTAELSELDTIVGQERAMAAITFGLEMETKGYNIFAAGASGTGRNFAVLSSAKAAAAKRPMPDDWCYVYNFQDPRRPRALRMPTGRGPELAKDLDYLFTTCRQEIPRVFESESYESRKEQATGDVQAQRNRILEELEREVRSEGFMLQPTPLGLITVPLVEGHPMSREQFEALPEAKRREIDKKMEVLRDRVQEALGQVRQLERQAHDILEKLDTEVAMAAVGDRFTEVKAKYAELPDVVAHIDGFMADIVEHQSDLRSAEPPAHGEEVPSRYRANVLVTSEDHDGAPVVEENSPTYYNLMGRLEYRPVAAGAITDHMLIKPGAMHRANGGYLIMQALDVLLMPFAWDALKRTLRGGEIAIENIGEQWSPVPAATLRPDPIPLDVKVILVGSPMVYFILYQYDEEFGKLFKVRADFDGEMKAGEQSCSDYARFAATYCRQQGLRHLGKDAVARLIDYGKRLVEDQTKLSAQFSMISGLLDEANFWAGRRLAQRTPHASPAPASSIDGARDTEDSELGDLISRADIEKALEQHEYRVRRLEDRIQEFIERGDLVVDVEGSRIGQVNGLAVFDVGDHMFGRPTRITARVTPGRSVVDIERESRLSGQIHQKAVLILTGFLNGAYASEAPLSLSASIAFEQSYGPIEGDSASCAELYAILSALAEVPIRQGIAVTGSVDQLGNVQVIGGVNYKIEGFYATCKAKGLTGDQGVLIPAKNVKNLMLRPEVVKAVEEGKFHIWGVSHVDEGIEVLTGIRAGSTHEPETIHGCAHRRLQQFAEALKGGRDDRSSTVIEVPVPGGGPRPPQPPTPPREPPGPPPPPIPRAL
ncbi:MAG: Lon protease family protein [Armatimonadota bacterium]